MYKIDKKQDILLSTCDYGHYFVIINLKEYNLKIQHKSLCCISETNKVL